MDNSMNLFDIQKWDIRFIELAKHISGWSKDPSTKVGAVIVDQNNVVCGMGYNGFPRGVKDNTDRYDNREIKYQFIVHAELNAILNSNKPLNGCSIYVWPTIMIPAVCPECCKSVIQAGIKEVISLDGTPLKHWQEKAAISRAMLEESGVRIRTIKI